MSPKIDPKTALAWGTVVAELLKLGLIAGPQLAHVVKRLLQATGKTDVELLPEAEALSADTHSILAHVIAEAQQPD